MKEDIKLCVDSRKTAIINTYDIKNEKLKKKIDDLFIKIEEFAKTCENSLDFEQKFATNSLNQEYLDLFTEVGTKCTPKAIQNIDFTEDSTETVEEEVKSVGRAIKRNINYKLRDVPVVGDIITAKDQIDLFKE